MWCGPGWVRGGRRGARKARKSPKIIYGIAVGGGNVQCRVGRLGGTFSQVATHNPVPGSQLRLTTDSGRKSVPSVSIPGTSTKPTILVRATAQGGGLVAGLGFGFLDQSRESPEDHLGGADQRVSAVNVVDVAEVGPPPRRWPLGSAQPRRRRAPPSPVSLNNFGQVSPPCNTGQRIARGAVYCRTPGQARW
jgi:hypothetical protein